MRTVDIHESVGFESAKLRLEIPREKIEDLVGHMAIWGMTISRYAHVTIYLGGDGNITATYRPKANEAAAYTMLGIWEPSKGRYVLHSYIPN